VRRLRFILAGNTATLLVTLFVASTAYAVLSATTETSRLAVRGTVDENAPTAAYDILVRPPEAVSEAERDSELVQPGFLGATTGGISLNQWRRIEGLRGVEVAAPVAVIGWTVPYVGVDVDLGEVATTTRPVVVRRTIDWTYDNGASSLTSAPVLVYVTPNPVELDISNQQWVETKPNDDVVRFPLPVGNIPQTVEEPSHDLFVVSTRDLGTSRVAEVPFPFPFLITAVDPEAEAELSGVRDALVDGEWLEPGPLERRTFTFDEDDVVDERSAVPVVVADGPLMRMAARYTVEVLDGPAVQDLAANGVQGELADELSTGEGRLLDEGTFDQDLAYDDFLAAMTTPEKDGDYFARSLLKVHRTSALDVRVRADGTLVPQEVADEPIGWGNSAMPGDTYDSLAPPGSDDTSFRSLEAFVATGLQPPEQAPQPALVKVGVFDASLLPGTTSLARVPLGTFAFAPPVGADEASRSVLGDQPWYPGTAISGYLQPPPLMLTTLDALAPFETLGWSQPGQANTTYDGFPPVLRAKPISAIRVRVEGADGVDALSRERVRSVAEDITESTGLAVDITLGSSPGAQQVEVAAGTHGRPTVTVTELWVSKGVAARLIRGIDRTSLLLSLVVLATAGLVVGDTVYASVRARRREIGILLSLGWAPRHVGARVLVPVLASALVAGLAGAAAAYVIRLLLDLDVDLTGVLVAIPAAIGLALLAATWPAVAAARTSPVDAMRPPARRTSRRRVRRVRSVAGIAWNSVFLAPGRTVAAMVGVATATAAVGSLLAVQAEFRGRAAGTLLGDAVAVQVRTPDLVAALLTLVLAGFGVHHVMATEIRERRAELATLRAVGWRDATVARLLLLQAAIVSSFGAVVGGLVAWWFLGVVFEVRSPAMLGALAAAGAIAVLVAVLVTLLPVGRLRSASVGRLLSED
jgi:putative ABC transport system permease protein